LTSWAVLLQLGLFAAFNIELAPWMMIAEIVGVNNTTIFTTIPAKLMATFASDMITR